ncbi:uncharacterized protein LOC108891062 isoform X2 [Lates calcarifer]|uniref:Uncharacterized protein LOC108891062 isoform X2 n=1 Tax=Lates calcarifer TaxID=8187 RepID=A0AAJ7VAN9_LATCA|nr:uncharacterized protein LOC108891062 isoform X2 [Lates calcarifer]
MICWILLLIKLTSCVCAGTFVVNVTQTSYQAEENHNITLEWTFTTHNSSNFIFIFCRLLTDQNTSKVLYELHDDVEVSKSQDEEFSGRVQFDKDVLREGRIRLHVSRLRAEDSGQYQCGVITNYGDSSGECRLNVTAVDESTPQRPTVSPEPESQGWVILYVGLAMALTAAAALVVKRRCFKSLSH